MTDSTDNTFDVPNPQASPIPPGQQPLPGAPEYGQAAPQFQPYDLPAPVEQQPQQQPYQVPAEAQQQAQHYAQAQQYPHYPHHPEHPGHPQHDPAYAQYDPQHPYAHAQAQAGQAAQQMPPQQVPYPAPRAQKRGGKGIAFLVGLLGVIVGAALSVGVLYLATSGFNFSGTVDTSNITITPNAEDSELAEVVAAKVTPSVVNIDVYARQETYSLEDFFGGRNGSNTEDGSSTPQQTGLGSGVILTADGYILTNNHVVEGGEKFMVSLDNEELEARLVGKDASSDLAVIKVDATGLTPIDIGDSEAVNVGEWVMAVGSPYGLEKSVSTGIVSALYRSTAMQSTSGTTIYANLIQTDAAINPGNSGGALVNSVGELIGINTLINSTSGSNTGVGFAVPSNYAFDIAEQLINGKEAEHPYLGVMLYSVDASVAEQLGLSVQSGAYVDTVQPGSPAEQAGMQAGDVITSVNNKNISTSAELIIEVRGQSIGSTVSLGVNRDGKTQTIDVVLGSTTN
ncbi:MAG: trypsin-like peptidase domain-containing protein [Coriobacteriales bacterium]|nr:trypsin-like peptidase domain-containing protein [Coriobacteriales bacterium]